MGSFTENSCNSFKYLGMLLNQSRCDPLFKNLFLSMETTVANVLSHDISSLCPTKLSCFEIIGYRQFHTLVYQTGHMHTMNANANESI